MEALILTPVSKTGVGFLPDLYDSLRNELALLSGVHVSWRIQMDTSDYSAAAATRQQFPFLAAPWVSVRATGRRRGPGVTRTVGLLRSLRGGSPEVVVTIDADDVFIPGGLGLLLEPLQRDESLAWCCGGNTWFRHLDEPRSAVYPPGGGLDGFTPPGAVWRAWRETGVFPFAAATCAYRVRSVLAAGGWPGTPTGEDAALLLAVSDAEPGWSVTAPVFEYRKHPAQGTATDEHRHLRNITNEIMVARHRAAFPHD